MTACIFTRSKLCYFSVMVLPTLKIEMSPFWPHKVIITSFNPILHGGGVTRPPYHIFCCQSVVIALIDKRFSPKFKLACFASDLVKKVKKFSWGGVPWGPKKIIFTHFWRLKIVFSIFEEFLVVLVLFKHHKWTQRPRKHIFGHLNISIVLPAWQGRPP